MLGQLRLQRAYLEQVLNPGPPPDGHCEKAPRELAAGLPPQAAEVLLLCHGHDPAPWRGLGGDAACLVAALLLFDRLVPGRLSPDACERLSRHFAGARSASGRVEGFLEAAASCGLESHAAACATESLQAMLKNRPAACCALLRSYVGVVEDPDTGEESEQEVGAHCVMVVGGDLLGPSFVTFDPWGLGNGAISFWSLRDMEQAEVLGLVEVAPPPLPARA